MDRLALLLAPLVCWFAAPLGAQHVATIVEDDFSRGICRLSQVTVPFPKGVLPDIAGCAPVGEQRVALVFVEFPGVPLPAEVRSAAETNTRGAGPLTVANYIRAASFGKAWLTVDTFGPITIAPVPCQELYGIVDAAVRALDGQVDWRRYNRLVIEHAVLPACRGGTPAVGTVGCSGINSPSKGFVPMGLVWLREAASGGTIAHELGHTLGLGHSAILSYGAEALGAFDDPGTAHEYGDWFTVMGAVDTWGHYGAPHKALLGWIEPQRVSSSGIFTLEPYEQEPRGGAKALKVERGQGSGKWLWMEYHQPVDLFGDALKQYAKNAFRGALIRYDDPATAVGPRSLLLDFQPGGGAIDFSDAALEAGRSWADPYSPLTIQVNRAAVDGLEVGIQYDTPCAVPSAKAFWPAATSGQGAFSVTAPAGCQWTAGTAASWIRVTEGASSVGPATVRYAFDANPGTAPREAYLRIGRQSYPVSQAANCGVRVEPASAMAPAARSRGTVSASGGARGCLFRGGSDSDWLITRSGTYADSAVLSYVVRPNLSANLRSANLVVSGAAVRVTQAAPVVSPGARAGVFRDGLWFLNTSSGIRPGSLGQAGDIPIAGDWNGDGQTKIGFFRPLSSTTALWLLDRNGNGQWDGPAADGLHIFGQDGDVPLVGDWNGDGRSKIGFFRPLRASEAMWLLDFNGNGQWDGPWIDRMYFLGQTGDTPLVGDWTGEGMDRIGFFRNGMWLLDASGNGLWDGPGSDFLYFLGQAGDTPLVGDWSGDGVSKIGFYRAGMWLLDVNGDGGWNGPQVDRLLWYGGGADVPVVGDWLGLGIMRVGVFRAGEWLMDSNGDGIPDRTVANGRAGDRPIAGQW